jgi:hypothetical protein
VGDIRLECGCVVMNKPVFRSPLHPFMPFSRNLVSTKVRILTGDVGSPVPVVTTPRMSGISRTRYFDSVSGVRDSLAALANTERERGLFDDELRRSQRTV